MTDTGNTSGENGREAASGAASSVGNGVTPTPAQPTEPIIPAPTGTIGTADDPAAGRSDDTVPLAAVPVADAGATGSGSAAHTADGSSFRRDRRRGLLVPIVAAAVVAALIGGGVGAAITLAVSPHTSDSTIDTSTAQNSSPTLNNPRSVTAISAVAAKASPSVVTISVDASTEAGTGSGIVLSDDGYVLTNDHVVTLEGASSTGTITATTSGGRIYPATVVGTDPTNDLAVIKLTGASGLQPATFADSSKLNVGDTAIAIGAPLGLADTVTNGIVSALNRSITVKSPAVPKSSGDSSDGSGSGSDPFNFWDFNDGTGTTQATTNSSIFLAVIQTDAAINPGNSGGALFNANGQVIGVNVAIASASSTAASGTQSGSIGVGFAIPANIAKRIATELIDHKKATHGLLGASVGDAADSAKSTVAGATIGSVVAGGAAASAGLRAGDTVTRFNGVAISNASDLTAQVRALAGGSTASLTYVRDNQSATVSVKLGTYSG